MEATERLILRIPAVESDGFDIEVEANGDGLELRAGGAHFPLDGADTSTSVRDALGLIRDLLTPAMRLRETLAGGRPYRWRLESLNDDRWETEHEMRLLLRNYFGSRSERIYQNRHLPSRRR